MFEKKPKNVIRLPQADEDLQRWISLVNQEKDGAPSVQEKDLRSKTLAQLVDEVQKIVELGENRDHVTASLKFLASTIRNRDAHRYVEGIRSSQFRAIPDLLVPSLNALLGVLDRTDLSARLAGIKAQ